MKKKSDIAILVEIETFNERNGKMAKIGDKIAGSEPAFSLHPQTLNEAVERWDNGELLFSIELGGLGPGYEQAIQVTGMELIREFKDKFGDVDWDNEDDVGKINKTVGAFSNDVTRKLRLSGAQFDAAKNMAFVFIRNGWEKAIGMAPGDRHIQISKNFP